ncbi:acyltransferase domain-containing protein [Roseateles sp.]|uniref:acyltransferase domain-containing protein n=1 Tax=Roseateles sp. TaxID=1971397 RepID=UPI0039E8A0D7
MSLALLFPGQGAQHPQMLRWLTAQPDAHPALDAMAGALGSGWQHRFHDPTWLHANPVAQVLLTGLGIAAWRALAPHLPPPAVIAGYSVGELAAFAAADVFDLPTALELASARARLMSDSVAGQDTGLLAVQGPHAQLVAETSQALSVAIRINQERVIVGGLVAALNACSAQWSAAGLRCTHLPIAVASHTPFMASAAAAFAQRLTAVDLQPARTAVVCNFSASADRRPTKLAAALAGQIACTIRWDDCMDVIAERRVKCVLEVGPGTALASMWRERHPSIPVRSVDEFDTMVGVVRWTLAQLG